MVQKIVQKVLPREFSKPERAHNPSTGFKLNSIKLSSIKDAFIQKENHLKDALEPGFCCIGITDYCFFRCRMCDKWREDVSIDKKLSKPPKLGQWKKFVYQS